MTFDGFSRDDRRFVAAGVHFVREPQEQAHGTVAVFIDLYGNARDLLQPYADDRSWRW
ncbi:hypothetical protein [Hydrogenophaga defluvii]|uniref:hypothetical protein n=1 Tax=Hydrogenophaga defluvii TaxID=249410 RepID=UPI0036D28726